MAIPLRLNAPDQWPQAIKDSGIDLVTTATNHAMDKQEAGLYRTLDITGPSRIATRGNLSRRRRTQASCVGDRQGNQNCFSCL